MADIDEARKAAIRARVNAATPGPWGYRAAASGLPSGGPDHHKVRATVGRDVTVATTDYDQMGARDAEFIAHARTDVVDLLDALEKVERKRDLAVAHDRQPYPTVYAYDTVCAALNKCKEHTEALKTENRMLHEALDKALRTENGLRRHRNRLRRAVSAAYGQASYLYAIGATSAAARLRAALDEQLAGEATKEIHEFRSVGKATNVLKEDLQNDDTDD